MIKKLETDRRPAIAPKANHPANPAPLPHPVQPIAAGTSDSETLADIERLHVLRTLEKYHNNKSRTAKMLNISRSTLREKLKEYGLE